MKTITSHLKVDDPNVPRWALRAAIGKVLAREGVIEHEADEIPPHITVDLDKRGEQEDGMFLAIATINVPEPHDHIDQFLSAIDGADIGDDRKPL